MRVQPAIKPNSTNTTDLAQSKGKGRTLSDCFLGLRLVQLSYSNCEQQRCQSHFPHLALLSPSNL